MSSKVGCLPYAVGKQSSNPWLFVEKERLNDDDDDEDDNHKLTCLLALIWSSVSWNYDLAIVRSKLRWRNCAYDQQFRGILVRNMLHIGACANTALLTYLLSYLISSDCLKNNNLLNHISFFEDIQASLVHDAEESADQWCGLADAASAAGPTSIAAAAAAAARTGRATAAAATASNLWTVPRCVMPGGCSTSTAPPRTLSGSTTARPVDRVSITFIHLTFSKCLVWILEPKFPKTCFELECDFHQKIVLKSSDLISSWVFENFVCEICSSPLHVLSNFKFWNKFFFILTFFKCYLCSNKYEFSLWHSHELVALREQLVPRARASSHHPPPKVYMWFYSTILQV